MANDIFTRAKAYRKKHPKTAWADCVKACAGKKKAPAKKKAAVKKKVAHKKATVGRVKKKAAPKKAAPRKIKVKIKPGKKGSSSITVGAPSHSAALYKQLKAKKLKLPHGYAVESRLSGIHTTKMQSEIRHKEGLEQALLRHKDLLKQKGLKAGEKQAIRRDIKKYQGAIKTSKTHISALKRSI